MQINECFKLRDEIINLSKNEEGVFTEEAFLSQVLPDLLELKFIESEDIVFSYFKQEVSGTEVKINGYFINETGDRLQIFILNENTTGLQVNKDDLLVKSKDVYNIQFKRGETFVKKAINNYLELQDSDAAGFLVSKLRNTDFIDNLEVIELFLISPSVTVETRGKELSLKSLSFKDEEFPVSYQKIEGASGSKKPISRTELLASKKVKKNILITKKLIDMHILYDVSISKGYRHALEVDFNEVFNKRIEILKAADEENFESYLCVIPAIGLAKLYRKENTRLLEKNVRSFLNFRVEANSKMKETIKNEPERFIAYNNGLTITATDGEIEEDNGNLFLNKLTDFQIVNGGQTAASIYFSNKDGLDISKINLMAKINIAKNLNDEQLNTLISNISLYSNTQSKVSKVDLKSRNPQIDKIKSLSISVITPQGKKWFFEKARGEFSTMRRLAGSNTKRIDRLYPKAMRVTKTELGKYYTSWGVQPWLVKKGGEKVFRSFIEHISGDGEKLKPAEIDRGFYEELIAKTILFRELELIHGARNKAIGQLRSAVVPYSISILYLLFEGSVKKEANFDLIKIWKDQKLPKDLQDYMKKIMLTMYDWIRKYSFSDDLIENTKKEELWNKISKSSEVKDFLKSPNSEKIKKKYFYKTQARSKKIEVDFSDISKTVDLIALGKQYLTKLNDHLQSRPDLDYKIRRLPLDIDKLFPDKGDYGQLDPKTTDFITNLLQQVRENNPDVLEEIEMLNKSNFVLRTCLDKVIKLYSDTLAKSGSIVSEFDKQRILAERKQIKYAVVISTIGKDLECGKPPRISQLVKASKYFD